MTAAQTGPTFSSVGGAGSLRRSLGTGELLVYGLVFITPIAPFSNFGVIYNASGGMVPLVYLVGVVAVLFTAMCYVKMSQAYPSAGSVYSYATGTLGPGAGFVAGWMMLLDYLLLPAVVFLACAVAIQTVVPGTPRMLWVTVLVGLATLINIAGVKIGARVNLTLLILQLFILALFMVVALSSLVAHPPGQSIVRPFHAPGASPTIILGALAYALLSFLGFDAISTLAEEAKDGRDSVGRATLIALLVSASLFVAQSYLASLFVLDVPRFAPGDPTYQAFYDIAARIGGPTFKFVVSIPGLLLSAFAGAVTAQAATARLLFSMGRDGRLPRVLSRVSLRFGTPWIATVLVALLSLAIAATLQDRLETLNSMVSFGALTGFLILHASTIRYYQSGAGATRLIWTLVPLAGAIITAAVLLATDPHAKVAGSLWLALGLASAVYRSRSGKPQTG